MHFKRTAKSRAYKARLIGRSPINYQLIWANCPAIRGPQGPYCRCIGLTIRAHWALIEVILHCKKKGRRPFYAMQ